uniref:Uncharacterized protein n=1 Tax=Arundo donax TaxID=35708 RepID=A0A0A8ZEG3_ARUDO
MLAAIEKIVYDSRFGREHSNFVNRKEGKSKIEEEGPWLLNLLSSVLPACLKHMTLSHQIDKELLRGQSINSPRGSLIFAA